MPYPAGHKAATHDRILKAASKLFRVHGGYAVGVDDVMAAAGLTRGGFYAHFRTKSALFAEALATTFAEARRRLAGRDPTLRGAAWLERAAALYLGREHLENPDLGCAVPTLGAEAARGDEETRRAYTQGIREVLLEISARMELPAGRSEERALQILTVLVGGMTLARGLDDVELQNRLLAAARRLVTSSAES